MTDIHTSVLQQDYENAETAMESNAAMLDDWQTWAGEPSSDARGSATPASIEDAKPTCAVSATLPALEDRLGIVTDMRTAEAPQQTHDGDTVLTAEGWTRVFACHKRIMNAVVCARQHSKTLHLATM